MRKRFLKKLGILCLPFLPGLDIESDVVLLLLPDDLDGDPVHVGDPEGEPHLSAGPGAEDLGDGVLGGQLGREGLLRLLIADEHKDLLVGPGEGDLRVVLQRPHGVLPDLRAIDRGSCKETDEIGKTGKNKKVKRKKKEGKIVKIGKNKEDSEEGENRGHSPLALWSVRKTPSVLGP